MNIYVYLWRSIVENQYEKLKREQHFKNVANEITIQQNVQPAWEK